MSMVFESQKEAYDDIVEYDDFVETSSAIDHGSDAEAMDADGNEFDDDDYDDTPVFSSNSGIDDFIGESSIVFDVDDLVAAFEAETEAGSSPSARLRKRLEALAERKRRHAELLDFDDYELD